MTKIGKILDLLNFDHFGHFDHFWSIFSKISKNRVIFDPFWSFWTPHPKNGHFDPLFRGFKASPGGKRPKRSQKNTVFLKIICLLLYVLETPKKAVYGRAEGSSPNQSKGDHDTL